MWRNIAENALIIIQGMLVFGLIILFLVGRRGRARS